MRASLAPPWTSLSRIVFPGWLNHLRMRPINDDTQDAVVCLSRNDGGVWLLGRRTSHEARGTSSVESLRCRGSWHPTAPCSAPRGGDQVCRGTETLFMYGRASTGDEKSWILR